MIEPPIQGPLSGVPGAGLRPAAGPGGGQTGGPSFADTLKESISEVNRLQEEADQAVQNLATGQETNLHETMLALEKADLSFRLMMQVRNKIVDAYQEIMRTQL